ncbi:hypothetical protein LC048_07490 [Mesobacillus subterraneus]|uniref:hypothetical protein n=1 Tax=Mesobacillus subterraneus TaxID=285983 RepID=UPI001CFCA40E|nr:hypothetical protein [Mesobacillus subterraneus]WLR56719.1 hypothetical protein LC048_07490 [Mesobacillus subterraneus]
MKKNVIMGIGIILALWLILELAGINSSYVIPNVVEWTIKFILPWIFLYWLIRLTKSLEKHR